MIAFLLAFGAINLLTPVVLLSNDSGAQQFDAAQRKIMRNMIRTGVCLTFISLTMMVI